MFSWCFLSHRHLWPRLSNTVCAIKKFLTESYILYLETRFWAKVAQRGQKRLKRSKKTKVAKSGPKLLFPNIALKIQSATVFGTPSGHQYIFDYVLYQIYITTDPRFQMGLVGGKVHRALRSKLHQLLIWTRAPLQWRAEGAITLSVIFPLPNFLTASNKKNLDCIEGWISVTITLSTILPLPNLCQFHQLLRKRTPAQWGGRTLPCSHSFSDLTIAEYLSPASHEKSSIALEGPLEEPLPFSLLTTCSIFIMTSTSKWKAFLRSRQSTSHSDLDDVALHQIENRMHQPNIWSRFKVSIATVVGVPKEVPDKNQKKQQGPCTRWGRVFAPYFATCFDLKLFENGRPLLLLISNRNFFWDTL